MRGGWNKSRIGEKVDKSINVEVGINVEVEKILEINRRGEWKCAWRVEFFFQIQ